MQDIHSGFQSPDLGREASQELFEFLDAAAALPSIVECRRLMAQCCPPAAGMRVVDLGCGVGHSALSIAQAVGPDGSVLGVDLSPVLVGEAQRRARSLAMPVNFQVADARALELPAASVDLVRTERVLMYLDQPEQVLEHAVHALRPSGSLVCFEFDYEGIVVDAPDGALTRDLMRRVTDSVPSPWIGRQLPRLFRTLGLTQVHSVAHMILTPLPMFRRVVAGTLTSQVHAGALTDQAVQTWWRTLDEAEASGCFLAGFSGFIVSGRRPG